MASYSNAGEVLFACLTIYNLRGVERIFGSKKYAVPSNRNVLILSVLPDILLLHKLDSSTPPPRGLLPSLILKQTQLPSPRANASPFLPAHPLHPQHPTKLHRPPRRQYPP